MVVLCPTLLLSELCSLSEYCSISIAHYTLIFLDALAVVVPVEAMIIGYILYSCASERGTREKAAGSAESANACTKVKVRFKRVLLGLQARCSEPERSYI